MYLAYYNYWVVGSFWHSEEAMSLLANFYLPAWFYLPGWWQYVSIVLWLSTYILLIFGYTIFRHFLLFLILLSFILNISVELTLVTNVDMILLDIWRLSDGALLYLLYFQLPYENEKVRSHSANFNN